MSKEFSREELIGFVTFQLKEYWRHRGDADEIAADLRAVEQQTGLRISLDPPVIQDGSRRIIVTNKFVKVRK